MSGRGKRRSARLLKLEEQKNDDGSTVCLLDPWQIVRNIISGARGKRKRNDEIQKSQGDASCSQPVDAANTSKSSTGQIIDYILDTLEIRDKHELFAMPDDIQVSDYAERVNKPSDLATLRQKNKDGMYNTLEQFENDVYMVFQKAMSINSQDTIPYREAVSLLDQARQVFLSLKSNQMYSESDLLAWSQKHLGQLIKPARKEEEGSNGGSRDPATATRQRPTVPAKKKGAPAKRQESTKAGDVSADKSGARRRSGAKVNKTTPIKRARKAAAAETAELGGAAGVAQRRLAYDGEADQGGRGTTTMPASQDPHATLVYLPPTQGHSYQDSLRRFVRHAGLKARVAAELKILECDARARQSPVPTYWNGLVPSNASGAASFLPHGSHYPQSSPPSAAAPAFQPRPPSGRHAVGEEALPWCKLETDELLKLLVLMGKPAFLERAKQMFGDTRTEETGSRKGRATKADDDARVSVRTAAPGKKSGASEPASDFGPFAPPKLVPGRLGFGQFAGSPSQPFRLKPSTSKASGKGKQKALE